MGICPCSLAIRVWLQTQEIFSGQPGKTWYQTANSKKRQIQSWTQRGSNPRPYVLESQTLYQLSYAFMHHVQCCQLLAST